MIYLCNMRHRKNIVTCDHRDFITFSFRFGKALFFFHCHRRNTFRIALDVMYKIDSLEETKNVVITIKSNDEKNVLVLSLLPEF